METNKIIELLKKAEDKVNSTMLSNIRKTEINLILLEIQKEAINYSQCCTQLPTIIEIDFDGHLKCQIETTDKAPTILKAVNGYGQPVDCNKHKIRINEI